MSANPLPDPYAAYGGKVASGGGADPYAAYGGQQAPDAGKKGFASSFADSSGLSLLGNVIAHPLDAIDTGVKAVGTVARAALTGDRTAMDASQNPIIATARNIGQNTVQNVQQGVKDYKATGLSPQTRRDFGKAVPIIGPAMDMATTQHEQGDNAGAVGTIAGLAAGLVAPEAIGDGLKAAPALADATLSGVKTAATATGQAAEDAGVGLMNKTVGTLKADFKRGANPGRGYLDTGNGPSISMSSIADKASDALDTTGRALGNAYKSATDSGTLIPFDDVAAKLAKPIQKAIDLETGPGGSGNVASIQNYVQQFENTFAKAEAAGGFTPSDLFDIKQSIAKNTNWSDPTQFNLKSVRQQQVGAISGILSDAVPETADLNQNYQDLTKLADRAQERANTGSRPLTAHIYKAGMTTAGAMAGALDGHALLGGAAGAVLDSVPFKTTLATGLYRGGQFLKSIATPEEGAAMEGETAQNLIGNSSEAKTGDPQGAALPFPNPSTSGPDKWAADGALRVAQHITSDPTSGLTKGDIAEALNNPKARRLVINASDLQPGSQAMKNLVSQIRTTLNAGVPH